MDEIWNTKVFVDKLPKSCNDCVVDHCGEWCCLNGVEIDTWSYNETRPKECPLKSLTDYTKQVRKEALADLKEKYREKMQNALSGDEEIGHKNCDDVLEELLEEIGFNDVLELYRSQGKWYA